MLAVFTLAVFLSASLLFMVQPMVAKMVLPRMGGSPAVWGTCMVFFQAVLLLGYGYAHILTRWRRAAGQVAAHAAVLAAGLIFLPIGLARGWSTPELGQAPPALWLLGLLAVSVAGPFFVVSTTAPLLQRWFSSTDHKDAKDPYFLYAASNVGSLLSLLLYPIVIERWLRLTSPESAGGLGGASQTTVWAAGYVLFAVLVLTCGVIALRRRAAMSLAGADALPATPAVMADPAPAPRAESGRVEAATTAVAAAAPTWRRRLSWVWMAFIPSSLMVGSTSHISTDVASIPLLWIVPLTLYLVTFIVAFSRRGREVTGPATIAFVILAVVIAASFRMQPYIRPPVAMLLLLHPLALLAAGLAWHGRLAQTRPDPRHLTEFFFLMSLGGVLGGAFNALLAPLVFNEVYEYPLVLVFAAMLGAPGRKDAPWAGGKLAGVLDVAAPLALAAAMIGADLWLSRWSYIPRGTLYLEKAILPGMLALLCLPRPYRMAGCLAVIFALSFFRPGNVDKTLYTERTFFGVNRVALTEPPAVDMEMAGERRKVQQSPFHSLYHGVTAHGAQFVDPAMRRVSSTYYHKTGPMGQVFEVFGDRPVFSQAAVLGLGAGALTAYGRAGQTMTFYEIDPAVIRIANDPRFFTYISDSAAKVECVEADGRIGISRNPDGHFGLIVLDAFSSDSIPVHLVTQEAFEIYLSKLAPSGLIVVNISNHYMDMRPVLGAIAVRLGLAGYVRDDDGPASPQQYLEDKRPSTWVVIARSKDDIHPLPIDRRWAPLVPRGEEERLRSYLWTDNYSNMLRIVKRYW